MYHDDTRPEKLIQPAFGIERYRNLASGFRPIGRPAAWAMMLRRRRRLTKSGLRKACRAAAMAMPMT